MEYCALKSFKIQGDNMKSTTPTEQEQFIRLPRIIEISGLGRSTIWSYVKMGKFPVPIKLSERVTVWRLSEINQWIEEKITEAQTIHDSSLKQINKEVSTKNNIDKKLDIDVYRKGGES